MFNLSNKMDEAQAKINMALAKAILPVLLERKKVTVQQAIDGLVEGQGVNNQYSTRYEINDQGAIGHITVNLGPISGSQEVVVGGNKTKTHTRTYDGQRPFQLPDGNWVTSSHIPAWLAKEHGYKALGYDSDV